MCDRETLVFLLLAHYETLLRYYSSLVEMPSRGDGKQTKLRQAHSYVHQLSNYTTFVKSSQQGRYSG
jgi:hypothetical protein